MQQRPIQQTKQEDREASYKEAEKHGSNGQHHNEDHKEDEDFVDVDLSVGDEQMEEKRKDVANGKTQFKVQELPQYKHVKTISGFNDPNAKALQVTHKPVVVNPQSNNNNVAIKNTQVQIQQRSVNQNNIIVVAPPVGFDQMRDDKIRNANMGLNNHQAPQQKNAGGNQNNKHGNHSKDSSFSIGSSGKGSHDGNVQQNDNDHNGGNLIVIGGEININQYDNNEQYDNQYNGGANHNNNNNDYGNNNNNDNGGGNQNNDYGGGNNDIGGGGAQDCGGNAGGACGGAASGCGGNAAAACGGNAAAGCGGAAAACGGGGAAACGGGGAACGGGGAACGGGGGCGGGD